MVACVDCAGESEGVVANEKPADKGEGRIAKGNEKIQVCEF